jgi:hypothetical protein
MGRAVNYQGQDSQMLMERTPDTTLSVPNFSSKVIICVCVCVHAHDYPSRTEPMCVFDIQRTVCHDILL